MRLKSMLVSLLGIGIAGGAVYVAQTQLVTPPPAQQSADATTVSVIVASQDIPFGGIIDAHKLTTVAWPVDAVPRGAFTDYSEVLPKYDGQPRRAERAFVQGELLLASKLSDFGEKVTIVQTLAENNRAMAIKVDAQSGVGGFVTPGDHVDVVLTQGRREQMRAIIVLQDIRVIGVDQEADEQVDKPGIARTVTVEVTPQQGQKLALAQQAGRLSLTLRSLVGEDPQPTQAVHLRDILLDDAPIEDSAPKPVVRVRRGTAQIEVVQVPVIDANAEANVEDASVEIDQE